MRHQLEDQNKKLIPLRRLAEISSYSPAYISILVQRKKLKAKKIGNKYYSTRGWFNQYLELHARDEKRLSSEAVRETSFGQTAEPQVAPQTEAILKTQIDNLVERAIKEKLEVPASADEILSALDSLTAKPAGLIAADQIEKKAAVEKQSAFFVAAEKDLAALPALNLDQAAALEHEPKNLKNIFEEPAAAATAGLTEDLVEPGTKLEDAWQKSFISERKDLLKRQKEIIYKIKSRTRKQSLNVFSENFISWPLLLKTTTATLTILLVVAALNYFAPAVSSGLSHRAGQALSRTAVQVKQLAVSGLNSKYLTQTAAPLKPTKELTAPSKIIIPGSGLAEPVKAALNNIFVNLSARAGAPSLKLENQIKRGREILTVRLKALKNQTLASTGSLKGKLIKQIARLAEEEKVQPTNLPTRLAEAPAQPAGQIGAVNGANAASADSSPLARLLTLANQKAKQVGRVLGISEGGPEVYRSENYQIKQMNFGGEMIFLSDENIGLPLTISEVRSESATDLNGEINKLLVFWNTNKLAASELSYFRVGENETSAKKIKDSNFSFSHSAALNDLDKSTVYNFIIKATDRWGNEAMSNRFAAYSGIKPVSIFQLIINTLEESFNWAIKEEKK